MHSDSDTSNNIWLTLSHATTSYTDETSAGSTIAFSGPTVPHSPANSHDLGRTGVPFTFWSGILQNKSLFSCYEISLFQCSDDTQNGSWGQVNEWERKRAHVLNGTWPSALFVPSFSVNTVSGSDMQFHSTSVYVLRHLERSSGISCFYCLYHNTTHT